jgi:hypothetical protein
MTPLKGTCYICSSAIILRILRGVGFISFLEPSTKELFRFDEILYSINVVVPTQSLYLGTCSDHWIVIAGRVKQSERLSCAYVQMAEEDLRTSLECFCLGSSRPSNTPSASRLRMLSSILTRFS